MNGLSPGTTGRLNDRCGWPERWGLTAVVVDVTDAGHEWPVARCGRHEVVVRVEGDPIAPATLANGQQWSCIVDIASLDVITRGGAS